MDKTIGEQFTCYHPIDEKGNIVAGLSINTIPEGDELIGEMVEDEKGNITIVPMKAVAMSNMEKVMISIEQDVEKLPMENLRSRLSHVLKRIFCLEQAVMDICDKETKEKIEARQNEFFKGSR